MTDDIGRSLDQNAVTLYPELVVEVESFVAVVPVDVPVGAVGATGVVVEPVDFACIAVAEVM